ncbi:polyprenyl synthetase family protein [Helicobacter suis]|uniref:polyprenyl synthetase family protein n=1 Tax=Helicobacter suis TaxID=104628 RepID=UPI0001F7A346|nr:polyprenyl synthetase family protein [Helicobacter suis]EFX43518.1 geranyltranstransferase [Helicobacter suis HS1]BCD47126.1 Geranyltranstransferase IspA [Helicobacter suis]BDR27654.1 geranyltranstransferase [Helicobacter suis HS1]
MSASKLRAYENLCQDFEVYLKHAKPKLKSFHPTFEQAFWEMLLNGGKRFRPKLLLAVLSSFMRSHLMIKNAFPIALALEVLHTYSLIHDDLPCMDNAPLRRYHPTLHVSYGVTVATLVGDGLNTYAFELLSSARLPNALKVSLISTLAHCGGVFGMVLGQAIDCYFEHKPLLREQLEILHTLKTAKLIAASLKMGALIAKKYARTPTNLPTTLFNFGLKLGLFFQVRDDIIDRTKSPEESGKSTQLDTFKNNYVNLLGLKGAQDYLKTLQTELKATLNTLPPLLALHLQTLLESLA